MMSHKHTENKFRAGLVQMSSTNERGENMEVVGTLIRRAANRGAKMVLTPEMTPLLELDRTALLQKIYTEESDPSLPVFQAWALELGIWLIIGSMAIKYTDEIVNRCYVISPDGQIAAHYDKIHMFDVDLPGGEQYRESRSYRAGNRAVILGASVGKVTTNFGLSICYDLRFPYLYRMLAHAGAEILTVPAAFTHVTGEAHWHILLRARAIENGAFIFAAAQTGSHKNAKGEERNTFGHSLFVDPWGNIIDDGGVDVGVVVAEIDLTLCKKARSRIPSLDHDRVIVLNKM